MKQSITKLLQAALAHEQAQAPRQHSQRTPACPAPGADLVALQYLPHVVTCVFCQKLLGMVDRARKKEAAPFVEPVPLVMRFSQLESATPTATAGVRLAFHVHNPACWAADTREPAPLLRPTEPAPVTVTWGSLTGREILELGTVQPELGNKLVRCRLTPAGEPDGPTVDEFVLLAPWGEGYLGDVTFDAKHLYHTLGASRELSATVATPDTLTASQREALLARMQNELDPRMRHGWRLWAARANGASTAVEDWLTTVRELVEGR